MTKKQIIAPDTVRSDYTLMQITLTVAVESFFCDEHAEMRESEAVENVLNRFQAIAADDTIIGDDIIVLSSKFETLDLVKRAQS
jgi:hypothetical protein